ncbi:hypothetical protein [Gelidibacter maritimus]|uniref:Uncharacterized protein n=1 Tax=Gelidibacter maritimus TaxID=2761487 RepID=A0A7W2M5Y5_9FLAO|nr:hypothetical protein [Gelidibacter maritimus]MBA6153308.1 hypothetical protein [Gelidibacter maritimus]
MKHFLILTFVISFFSCQSVKKNPSEASEPELPNTDLYEPLESEASSDEENYQAAINFINSYIESIGEVEILEFVRNSPLASEKLKSELENIVILAWEENPKIGLLADPLVDAQDYPANGFELYEHNAATGYVIVKGIDWDEFKLAMQLVKEDGHILVDGCGIVNMPKAKRVER